MAGTADEYNAEAALAEFYASRSGVRGLAESGVASVPPLFLVQNAPVPVQTTANFAIPTVDLSRPRPATVQLVGAAARAYGIFHVTNHGVGAGISAVLSAVRAFHELPLCARSTLYTRAPVGDDVFYTTMRNDPPRQVADPAAIPVLPWRDTLLLSVSPPGPNLGRLPAACRDALLEYHRVMVEFGKTMAGLLSEALGVGAERLEAALGMEPSKISCHYYPPCPEPARVVGSLDHTDPFLFTVLAQDSIGGLAVRLDDSGAWMDVTPVPGALVVFVADVLKVVSNDVYKSVYHRVRVKSTQDGRVSTGIFFNPSDSNLIGPLPELVTAETPQRYRSFTMAEFMDARRDFGHGSSAIDRFAIVPESS